jgi:hypothetical protein
MLNDAESALAAPAAAIQVHHLRQVLLWPLRLVPAADTDDSELRRAPWLALRALGSASPWVEQQDEYTGDASHFHERHYTEFVSFLPYVQRFLYGQGRRGRDEQDNPAAGSPMRIFRRHDIAALRVVARPGDAAVRMQVVHIDLYFFYGVDVVLLNVELEADGLPMPQVQELLYRGGRAFPAGWDDDGMSRHSLAQAEWLDAAGQVLCASDSGDADAPEAYLAHVAEHRAPRFAPHWEFVLAPLVNHHSAAAGRLRVRQIEYYRMPMMAYLAVDDPQALSRADFVRLGLGLGADGAGSLPQGAAAPGEFEARFCYDRFWGADGVAPHTRYLCSGQALVVVGDAKSAFYRCRNRGVLAQFRHQHFLLFLIAHFQKATLLMMSDQLSEALMALNVAEPDSVKRFKRRIRIAYVAFLSFTHRYWFHGISEQLPVKTLFNLARGHLEVEPLYAEVKERIHDMNGYLDADSIRRQANTVVRLTVVTIFGLIGTVTTGFLGMNLLAEADSPLVVKVLAFLAVFVPTIGLTLFTIVKSKRLSDFLDVLSDERVPAWHKLKAFFAVWGRG